MHSRQFHDGLVELQASGNNREPGYHGQAGNVSSCWFRVDGGPWERGRRTLHRNVEALECADSVREFRQLLEIL